MTWFAMMSILLLGFAVFGTTRLVPLIREWQVFQQWCKAQHAPSVIVSRPVDINTNNWEAITLPGAAMALKSPPSRLQDAVVRLRQHANLAKYPFPIGWYRGGSEQAELLFGSFVGDVNHMLITGMSDTGKDNLALNILFTLALTQPPERLQIAVVDGKGLDFSGWRGKAHSWRLALKPDEIRPTMVALTAERERRRDVLEAAGVSKWDHYTGDDLALLVVYISELSLLKDATSARELGQWLNSELAAGRAFGIRYVVATQTASNYDTQWRSQIGVYLAAYQPSQSQDEPNTGLATTQIRAAGATPPSELPELPKGAGVFTVCQGRRCVTVRATHLGEEQRQGWVRRLPDAVKPSTKLDVMLNGQASMLPMTSEAPALIHAAASPAAQNASTALECPEMALHREGESGAAIADVKPERVDTGGAREAVEREDRQSKVLPEERARILAEAPRYPSRRQLTIALYGSPGGKGYDKVKTVLDEHEAIMASAYQLSSTA